MPPALPASVKIGDPAALKAHARALGPNTGSTSCHLREPARYGFAGEAGAEPPEARGATPSAQRERWWQAVPGDRRFPPRRRRHRSTVLTRLVARPAPDQHDQAHNRRETGPS
ncbi:hypothetical protein [Streptomyces sp. YKOK-I1]